MRLWLALLLSLSACGGGAGFPDAGPPAAVDGGIEEDGGAGLDGGPAEDGGVPIADGAAPPADGGVDDRIWPPPDFSRRVPSTVQDPALGINVYFSPSEDTRGVVVRELAATRRKLHAAMFNITDAAVKRQLLALHDGGVQVQILWDKTQAEVATDGGTPRDDQNFAELARAGIDQIKIAVTGAVGASMHDKFAILDDARVLTGSANWSFTGFSQNLEHIVTLEGPTWAQKFETEYQRIRTGVVDASTNDPSSPIRVYFGPGDRLHERMIDRIQAARRSIYVGMFDLTYGPLADALVAARQRGVRVIFVMDRGQADEVTYDERIENAGAVVLRGTPGTGTFAKMHQKYSVYDDEWVILGSYNWTALASFYNRENVVEVRSPRLAARVTANLLEMARQFDASYTNPERPPSRYGFTPGDVQVTLEVRDPALRPDDTLYVGGDAAFLGPWERSRAVAMTRRGDGWWEATLTLPAGRTLEYKYLVRDRFGERHWEGGPKHFYTPVFSPAQQRWADVYLMPPR